MLLCKSQGAEQSYIHTCVECALIISVKIRNWMNLVGRCISGGDLGRGWLILVLFSCLTVCLW